MLVKMQRPLASNAPEGMALMLVYNRDRSYYAQVLLTDEYRAMFEQHGLPPELRAKLFAEVTVGRRGAITIHAISDGDHGW